MGDLRPGPPQLRPGRALAHTTGASGSGSPHRSDGRPPQTPRGARRSDPDGRLGTTPPVPGRPTSFLRFPLVGLLGLLGLPALLFALITWQVVAHGPLLRLDSRLSSALVHPDRFSELLSDLGNVQVAVPVLVLVIAHVARRGRATGTDRWWLPPTAAAVLMALVPAVIVPLKDWTARPGTPVVPPAVGYFPSGHTATAAIAYGSATLILLPWLTSAAARRTVVAGCAALVLGVSYGLVRRGWHWPLDVVASWCLATVLLTSLGLVLTLTRNTRRSSSRTPSSSTGPS
ncbi:phosphatase PAP2 family protein [Streptomyces sp. NPDC054770]